MRAHFRLTLIFLIHKLQENTQKTPIFEDYICVIDFEKTHNKIMVTIIRIFLTPHVADLSYRISHPLPDLPMYKRQFKGPRPPAKRAKLHHGAAQAEHAHNLKNRGIKQGDTDLTVSARLPITFFAIPRHAIKLKYHM